MTTFTNAFAALSVSSEAVELSVNISVKNGPVQKKATPKKASKAKTTDTLRDDIAVFERDYPVCAFLFRYKGKDQFVVFNFKISHTLWVELSARGVKKITLPVIQRVMNERSSKLGDVVVWESYFEKDTLIRLTKQEYFKVPSEFKSTIDLVRGEPITRLGYSPVIIFDYRLSNSKQEFVYLPNGSRVHFGKAYDDYRVSIRESSLRSIMKHYERSLVHFRLNEVYRACDEIISLTAERLKDKTLTADDVDKYTEDSHFADEAAGFIAKYVHLHDDDEQAELRNLLTFTSWPDDLKKEFERAKQYRNDLFDLWKTVKKEVSEIREHKKKSQELHSEEYYPSLA